MVNLKRLSLPLLVVLVMLAGTSPAFANGLTLTPKHSCRGTKVLCEGAPYPLLSSSPPGLIGSQSCQRELGGGYSCIFAVSGSAPSGSYTVSSCLDETCSTGTFTVDPCPAVGGVVMPVDTFAVLGPWLAVIGLVGLIGTVVLVARKRHD
jgi:hypothetical protein